VRVTPEEILSATSRTDFKLRKGETSPDRDDLDAKP
jgi:hypothetical protein